MTLADSQLSLALLERLRVSYRARCPGIFVEAINVRNVDTVLGVLIGVLFNVEGEEFEEAMRESCAATLCAVEGAENN